MPTSDRENKAVALEWYLHQMPDVIVDIGAGEGTYANLMRPFHRARWIAIEAWGSYVTQHRLDDLYDQMIFMIK